MLLDLLQQRLHLFRDSIEDLGVKVVTRSLFILLLLGLVAPSAAQEKDLFAEAGASKERSRWVSIRTAPYIDISLRSDDTILIKSAKHPAEGFAMEVDGNAIAAECSQTENTQTHIQTSDTTVATLQHYWVECPFPEGTTARVLRAQRLIVQVSMTSKTTKPKELDPGQRARFQTLNR